MEEIVGKRKTRWARTKRSDVIRSEELEVMFHKLFGKDEIRGYYDTKVHGKPRREWFDIPCRMVECLLALLFIFGKRKWETLRLRKRDIYLERGYLFVRFRVTKKKSRRDNPLEFVRVKNIRETHPYVEYIKSYIDGLKPEDFLFPGNSGVRDVEVSRKWEGSNGEKKMARYGYSYDYSGHISPELAWKWVHFLNPDAWVHLFRTSLATMMAEHSYTEDELMHWFDWNDPRTAHGYVKGGTTMLQKGAEREF